MGCSNWVYPDTTPSDNQIHVSQAACVIDYLEDGTPFNKREWAGHHPRVGSDSIDNDNIVAWACALVKGRDVALDPLEVQMWWRDHQIMDQARLKAEAEAKAAKVRAEKEKVRQAKLKLEVLKKLSSSERALLGVYLSAEDKRLVKGLPSKKPASKKTK